MNQWNNFFKGIIKENPIFVILLGMCPTLGVSTSAINGIGMGAATLFVLVCSNAAVALVKDLIPDKVRIPAFVVIIAAFVTIVDLVMAAWFRDVYAKLGIFIPLIVVNCIILGRAEAFASKNDVFSSIIDAIGMGIGFTLALTLLGGIRETFGNGSIFGYPLVGANTTTILLFIMPPGAFIVLGYLIALVNKIRGVA
jgi:electron transport complex protein RnfE